MILLKRNKKLREEVEAELSGALSQFMLAQSVTSSADIEEAIAMPTAKVKLELSTENVMSVNVPKITVTKSEGGEAYPYSFASVTGELDASIATMNNLLVKLVELAEVEKTCNMLADEIEKKTLRK